MKGSSKTKTKCLKQGSRASVDSKKGPKIIILEGPDGCGKDTIENEIHRLTDHKHIIINRFLASNYVYAKLFKRKNFKNICKKYLEFDTKLAEAFDGDVHIFLLWADYDELNRRLKNRDDHYMMKHYNNVMMLFSQYLLNTRIKHHWIRNQAKSEYIAKIILQYI